MKKQTMIVFGALLLAGCETTNTNPYKVSTDNVIAIQNSLAGTKVNIGEISLASGVTESVQCRLSGDVVVAPGKTPHQYIKEALKDELFAAQAYQPGAPVTIEGQVEAFGFSSVSPAHWSVKLHVKSNVSPGYSVETNYPFETSWTAYSACKNVADAFGPTVSQLIHDVVRNPKFATLAKSQ
jgi:hypothetical protein